MLALAAASTASFGAEDMRAVTEDGRKVLLAPDGKWRFDLKARVASTGSSATDSTSPYQTAVKRFSLAFNQDDWTLLPKREGDAVNKRTFQHKRFPIFGMVISDEMPATTDAMKNAILYNASSAGATTTTLLDQTKKLGDRQIGELRMTALMKGIEFVFSTYYYADEDGNIQVMCYTGQSLFHKYQGECEKFLSGLALH